MIHVIARPDPVHDRLVTSEAPDGLTLAEIAGGVHEDVEAFIGSVKNNVPRGLWHVVRPKAGETVMLTKVPQDSDVGRLVALTVVSVAAVALGQIYGPSLAAAAGFAETGTAATLFSAGLTAAVGLAGSLAVNAIIPPQLPTPEGPGERFNRLASITGQSNQLNPFGVIPRLYGTHRIFPVIPMTARPYTEIIGDKQYLRWKGVIGYGPLEIGGAKAGKGTGGGFGAIDETTSLTGDPIKIGDTPITEFEDYQFDIYDAKFTEYRGLYKDQVLEQSVGANLDLQASYSRRTWLNDNVSITRTTDTGATEIGFDLIFPQGLFSIYNEGDTAWATVQFRVEYRAAGTSTWTTLSPNNANGITTENAWLHNSSSTSWQNTQGEYRLQASNGEKKTYRVGVSWRVPEGQYDIRVTRVRSHGTGGGAFQGDAVWSVLRTFRDRTSFNVENVTVMDLRIKATDQFLGSLDRVNVIATSVLPYYDGTSWQTPGKATNNPAWIYADMWAGTATDTPVPYSQLDADALKEWADFCDTKGLTYNRVIDSGGTVLNRARSVASTGRASWGLDDNRITVVRDFENPTPRLVVSPRIAWNFTEFFTFPDPPDAFRVKFMDPDTWEATERVVFDDGQDASTAEDYRILETDGVTAPDQAYKEGRYQLAQLRLRPYRQEFTLDVIHLVFKRGDTIALNYDVVGVGLQTGRVTGITTDTNGDVTAFTCDESLFMEAGNTYAVKLQVIDGGGEPALRTATIQTDSSSDGVQSITLDTPLADIQPGDHFVFGEGGRESANVKVQEIVPQGDLTAKVTVVPEAPAIHTADTGTIPAWDARINEPVDPTKLPPPAPTIDDVISDESALIQRRDGSLQVRMLVRYTAQPGLDLGAVQIRYRRASGDGEADGDGTYEAKGWSHWEKQEPDGQIELTDVEELNEYEIQLRVWGVAARQWSPFSASVYHRVIGKTSPPPNVTGIAVRNGEFDSDQVTWDYPDAPLDWSGAIIKVDGAEVARVGKAYEATVPPYVFREANTYTVEVIAFDTSGNESTGASAQITPATTPVPEITDITSDETVLIVQQDGSLQTAMQVTYSIPGVDEDGASVQMRWREVGATKWLWQPHGESDGTLTTTRIKVGVRYEVQVRHWNQTSQWSAFSQAVEHTVVGKTTPPPPITELLTEETESGERRFTWSYPDKPLDFAGVEFRANVGRNTVWDDAIPISGSLITQSPWETKQLRAGTWTVLARPMDTSGNVADESAIVVLALGDRLASNILETLDFRADGWPGTITNGSVDVDGDLIVDDTSDKFYAVGVRPFYSGDDELMYSASTELIFSGDGASMYAGNDSVQFYQATYPEMTYRDAFIPDDPGLLLIDYAGRGNTVVEYRRRFGDQLYSGDDETLFYNQGNDRMYAPASAYQPWSVPVQVGAEPIDIRVRAKSGPLRSKFTRLRAIVDAPDVIERFQDVAIAAGGTRLSLSKPFRTVKNISITVQDDGGSGVNARIRDKKISPGPEIAVLDASGTSVSGVVDATVQGIR